MTDTRLWTTAKPLQDALNYVEQAASDGDTSVSVDELKQFGFSDESLQILDAKQDGTGAGFISVSTIKNAAEDYYQKMSTLLGKANSDGQISVKDATEAGLSQVDADKLDANDGNKDGQISAGIVQLQLNDMARSLHKSEGALAAVSGNIGALKGMLDALKTTPDSDPSNPTHKKTTVDEAVKLLTKLGYSEADAQALAKQLDKDDGKDDGSIQLNRLANAALQRSTDLLGGTGDMNAFVTKDKAIEVLMQNGLTREQAVAAATAADGSGAEQDNKIRVRDLAGELSKILLTKLQHG